MLDKFDDWYVFPTKWYIFDELPGIELEDEIVKERLRYLQRRQELQQQFRDNIAKEQMLYHQRMQELEQDIQAKYKEHYVQNHLFTTKEGDRTQLAL